MQKVKVIGGGLAGVEATYQLLKAGIAVELYEMRPSVMTPAHSGAGLAELVCSNSLKSLNIDTPQGLLKAEMKEFDSIILSEAERCRVPAGSTLAVDRELFSKSIEKRFSDFTNLDIIRQEITDIDEYTIVASGPLTSDKLAGKIAEFTGSKHLHFFDAVAPIITHDSVNMDIAYYKSRYDKGDADYLNCPMTKDEYYNFCQALVTTETVKLKDFEKGSVFESCMPIEVMAKRGIESLRFGPLRPIGLAKDRDNKPYAVVQLRKEDNYDNLLNLVGFQTNLTFKEQKRVFSMIPGLENMEFVRYGVMHRNTFIDSPKVLTSCFNMKDHKNIFFAGQLTGVEGYMESAMSGLYAGLHMARLIKGQQLIPPPDTTMSGSLAKYISSTIDNFQPMHVSFGLLSPLKETIRQKAERKQAYADRALQDIKSYKKLLSST